MNKNAIKKFAIAARTRLIATVSDKAGTLGITKEGISEPSSKGNGFEVYKTSAGTEIMLQGSQMEQRRRLVTQVKDRGFDVVMEEVAYTWFNRICAIRFMEVNDYLPMRIRVLSSLKEGKNEPDLLTEAPNIELDFSEKEREWIINAKAENRLDELFSMLFIKQCNKLSEVLPELFEATEDYTEMLLNLSYTNKDDVIRMLVDGVDEKDFNVTTPDENGNPTGQVEIIGWLYQFYNTELKEETFDRLKKNVKINKERIPAATQLFTPDWIVRYMVENSVGRIWIDHLRAINPETNEKETAENFGWKYYLPEAEQEPEVNAKLTEIRKSYADIKPEDILCIDPCMGSGHIIVAMFDVLMDIYKSVGYGERDAAFEIVEHNLHGLDIDKRAYQLAYFAVMMKGRQYNRRFFRGKDDVRPQPNVFAFVESNEINRSQFKYFGSGLSEIEKNNACTQLNGLLDTFVDSREYGSILSVDKYDWDLLRRYVAESSDEGQMTLDVIGIDQTTETIKRIISIGEVMAKHYDAVVTNPPYMGASGMDSKLTNYVKKEYPDSKSDFFAVFMEKADSFSRKNGFTSLITMESWMFLSSFENLRKRIIDQKTIINMVHMPYLGKGGTSLGINFGTAAVITKKEHVENYSAQYEYTVYYECDDNGTPLVFPTKNDRWCTAKQERFTSIPGAPIAYWVSGAFCDNYLNEKKISDYAEVITGMTIGDNSKYLRLWFEPLLEKVSIGKSSMDEIDLQRSYWIPYSKGGPRRNWYGNYDYVVNWSKKDNFNRAKTTLQHLYLREALTWPFITTGAFSARILPKGFLWDVAGSPCFFDKHDEEIYTLAFLCSKVANYTLKSVNPTINVQAIDISRLPLIIDQNYKNEVIKLAEECIDISKCDWDSYETSWGFKRHPLACNETVEKAYNSWSIENGEKYSKLKKNEERINEIFIKAYGLEDDITPFLNEDDITIRHTSIEQGIRSLIMFAVGCMLGRYSLDAEGVVFAGGDWNSVKNTKYKSFLPDVDGIIPITDEEYFEDDIVGLFSSWLKSVYGLDTLEENLDFIARALGNKGDSSRDTIRNYFLNDFFKDHCSAYSVTGSGKRPIYWLFDSGKQNGFKALIYIHRYDQDTVGRVRTDYLHKTQKAIEQAMQSAQYTLDNSKSGTEKSKATKRISKYTKQLAEIQLYDEAIAHISNKRISLDLDDGVKVNYEKFQGVEVSREGMKTVKVDLLAKI